MNEIRRVLKKNGKFFLIVPCEGEKFTYTWIFQKIHLGQNLTNRYFGHVHPEFTHKSVTALLEKHGFVIENTSYSEHVFYQLMHLFIYFLPKVFLELFLRTSKTKEYANSALIASPKSTNNPLLIIRKFWFIFLNFMMMYPMSLETVFLRKISTTAWKLHVFTSKGDKK